MNTSLLISLCLLFAVCSSEPPKYRSARLQAQLSQQRELPGIDVIPLIPTEDDIPKEKSGPYPPSGWKPAGKQLELPTEKVPEVTMPANEYGSPVEVYGVPNENAMVEGPYPPSGWKPVGRQLELPSEKVPEMTTPSNEYGSPTEVYEAPEENNMENNIGPYLPSGWKPAVRQMELPSDKVPEATTPANEYGTPVEVYGAPAENNMAEKNGPYPPSGWRPAGRQLELPSEMIPEKATPATQYGSPVEVYGAPAEVYGPPAQTYGSPTATASADSTKVSEGVDTSNEQENVDNPKNNQPTYQQGAYYVLLPDSSLQKYFYNFVSDPARMQYSSRIQNVGAQSVSSPYLVYYPAYSQAYQGQW